MGHKVGPPAADSTTRSRCRLRTGVAILELTPDDLVFQYPAELRPFGSDIDELARRAHQDRPVARLDMLTQDSLCVRQEIGLTVTDYP